MKVLGIGTVRKSNGTSWNLHCTIPPDAYFDNPDAGRTFEGQMVTAIYVADFDCSHIKVGDEIEVYYDQARVTQKGTFQKVKFIQVIS